MNNKSRYWAFLYYPESDFNFISVLEEMGCVFAVGPLHDRDINPDGSFKKPHYHILLQFDGPTTYNNVKENICSELGENVTIPKKVISMRGYYRYLTHADNPEKAQYNEQDIKCFNGFKCELTNTEITYITSLICLDIEKEHIIEYSDLVNFYLDMGDYDRFDIVSNHTYFFDKYITSIRNKSLSKN